MSNSQNLIYSLLKNIVPPLVLATGLSACGGDGSTDTPVTPAPIQENPGTSGESTIQGGSPSIPSSPPGESGTPPAEPPATILSNRSWFASPDTNNFNTATVGFYDVQDEQNTPRPIRNDLSGSLKGMVQFVQTHNVNPAGNAAREMPTLTARRTTLLTLAPATPVKALVAKVFLNGQLKATLPMNAPEKIPAADFTGDSTGIIFSKRSWSVELPWQLVEPGLSILFDDQNGNTGTLGSQDIEMAAPAELVINTIQLGMLTDFPVVAKTHAMMSDPERAAVDYFQTTPVARLTIAPYEYRRLDRVIVATGKIYTVKSDTPGDVYSGDMRGDVAKGQISDGINYANFGYPSKAMNSVFDTRYEYTNRRVMHHAAGVYTNGVVTHGLSGGNGKITLETSRGNEPSHEFGHSYGMGHFPGQVNILDAAGKPKAEEDMTRDELIRHNYYPSHNFNSGWGYDAYNKRMRTNLSIEDLASFFPVKFNSAFYFNRDTMAGGTVNASYNWYTHVTGYTARRIQEYLNQRPGTTLPRGVQDTGYPSGYRAWHPDQQKWVDMKVVDPAFNAPVPSRVGVEVYTLVGGYNPADSAQTLMYAPLHGSYGTIFDNLPKPDLASAARTCWIQVKYANSLLERTAIDSTTGVKQFQLNVDPLRNPAEAGIYCQTQGKVSLMGNTVTFPAEYTPFKPVTVGQEQGFDAYKAPQKAELERYLAPYASQQIPALDMNRLLPFMDALSTLSKEAQKTVKRYLDQQEEAWKISSWLRANSTKIAAQDKSAVSTLQTMLRDAGFYPAGSDQLFGKGALWKVTRNGTDYCVTLTDPSLKAATIEASILAYSKCDNSKPEQRWFLDNRNQLHNEAAPQLCGSLPDGIIYRAIKLATCDSAAVFEYKANTLCKPDSAYCLTVDANIGRITQWTVPQMTTTIDRSAAPAYIMFNGNDLKTIYGAGLR